MKRLLITLLSLTLLTGLTVEASLRLVDPLGMWAYYADFAYLQRLSIPYADGFRYKTGNYRFNTYNLRITTEGLRYVVPNDSACQIAFVGDSVAFGMGANTSFVNILAEDVGLNAVNYGIPAYSAENIAEVIANNDADGYVWLIISNDGDPARRYQAPSNKLLFASEFYGSYLLNRHYKSSPPNNADNFMSHAAPLLARDDVLTFAFEGAYLTDTAQVAYPNVIAIPLPTGSVSRFDPHPAEQGHIEIASAMNSHVREFVARVCP